MRPILAIAGTTVGEAIRRKVLLIILLIGLVFMFVAPGLGVLSTRSETTVLKSVMLGIIQLTAAVIAIVLTVYMIPNEVERRTIYTILSKPVQRWQFLVGKYLGAVAALGLMMALMSLVLVGVFFLQQEASRNAAAIAELLKGPIMYFVQMSLLAALAIFFSTFVSPLVNFFLSGGIYLLGTVFNPFFTTMQENPATPQVAKFFATIVNSILPNFSNYNVQNTLINSGPQIQNETLYYFQTIGYGIAYIIGLLIAGIVIFDRREV
jgi:ABC-type transport system involved in multi-copper enzyme maturation permease subunit